MNRHRHAIQSQKKGRTDTQKKRHRHTHTEDKHVQTYRHTGRQGEYEEGGRKEKETRRKRTVKVKGQRSIIIQRQRGGHVSSAKFKGYTRFLKEKGAALGLPGHTTQHNTRKGNPQTTVLWHNILSLGMYMQEQTGIITHNCITRQQMNLFLVHRTNLGQMESVHQVEWCVHLTHIHYQSSTHVYPCHLHRWFRTIQDKFFKVINLPQQQFQKSLWAQQTRPYYCVAKVCTQFSNVLRTQASWFKPHHLRDFLHNFAGILHCIILVLYVLMYTSMYIAWPLRVLMWNKMMLVGQLVRPRNQGLLRSTLCIVVRVSMHGIVVRGDCAYTLRWTGNTWVPRLAIGH